MQTHSKEKAQGNPVTYIVFCCFKWFKTEVFNVKNIICYLFHKEQRARAM